MKKPSKAKPKAKLNPTAKQKPQAQAKATSKPKTKGLQGYEQISQDEDLRNFLPPGTQIQPGPFGGTTIIIPNAGGGINPTIPNFRGPWGEIRKEIYRFEVFASDEGRNRPAQADQPPKGVNELCDKWIAAFYQSKDRWNQPVPKKIAPWLIARALTASMFAAMEDSHGLRPPSGKLEDVMCGLLITFWNTGADTTWFGYHPDASSHSE